VTKKPYAGLTELELIRKMETHRRLAAAIAAELLKRAMAPASPKGAGENAA
jgi:hypothetical protein